VSPPGGAAGRRGHAADLPRRAAAGLLAALSLLGGAGCSLLPELLRMGPVEVLAYRPDQELVDPESVPHVSVWFSSPMNRTAAEEAFSLQEGSERREGRFSWQEGDSLLVFTPLVPLAAGFLYTVAVSAGAEDVHGNSLAEPLRFQFRTGTDDRRPRVVRLLPVDGAVVGSPRERIVIEFSEPMDAGSLYAGFSLFPPVPGGFVWTAGGQEVTFLPLADYGPGSEYAITLRASIADRSGNTLAEELSSHFRAPAPEDPEVAGVATLAGGVALEALSAGMALNRDLGIEKDERFVVSFTSPVPPEQRGRALGIEPRVSLELSWSEEPAACTVGFADPLSWDRVYTLTVLGEQYAFLVDGPSSRPPSVEAVKLCLDLGALEPVEFISLEYAGNYGFGETPWGDAAFDVHVSHAEAAQLDLGSFLDALGVSSTGGCVDLEWHEAAVNPAGPSPEPPPGPGRSVVRLHCAVADDPAAAGTVAFRLSTGFRDSLDNRLPQEFTLLFNVNTPPEPEP